MWVLLFMLLVVAILAFIRLSPNDPAKWHTEITSFENKDMPGGVIRVIDGDAAKLRRLDEVIGSTGGQMIGGSVDAGHMTYISRTAVIAFPDFTTVQLKDGKIALYGRLRFGSYDMGVNKRRIDAWLVTLANIPAQAPANVQSPVQNTEQSPARD